MLHSIAKGKPRQCMKCEETCCLCCIGSEKRDYYIFGAIAAINYLFQTWYEYIFFHHPATLAKNY